MDKITTMLQILLRDERHVGAALAEMSERHRDEHEITFVARDLAAWCDEHLAELDGVATKYGARLTGNSQDDASATFDRVRADLADRTGGEVDEGVLLLRELRALHLACVGLSVEWEIMAQTAKAVRDDDLLALAERCQRDAARQMKWANAKVKEAAPQVMAS
jgi:hypothetical protein